MPFRRETWHWPSAGWWLVVTALAVLLKHHYSIASAADLEWMFRPLSLLLEGLTGHEFHRDDNFEWVSESADVRLVKSCAGINFMLMSFVVYAWVARPDPEEDVGLWALIAAQLLLLTAAITASWATCLLANSLRIIVAMAAVSNGWELGVIGLDAAELHRVIGIVIYVPLLSLQMMLGNHTRIRDAFMAPVLLYLLLMIIVPLLTGNALQNPAMFTRHLLNILVMIAIICSVYFITRIWHPQFEGYRLDKQEANVDNTTPTT
ncbi:hypothetical protein MNBD_GAMMA15-2540 [hydrothermal vent metagenome]|uniref:Exosortase K n=1 Tax=hydrothermal vent metagenome TaxID=652676 RepID=A0A3B0YEY6_9ZZZZ